jgi:hypothetical protein
MTLIVPKANRDTYRRHAAPESIQANLVTARRRAAVAAEEVDWLETLLARRQHQVREGEWPSKAPEPTMKAGHVHEWEVNGDDDYECYARPGDAVCGAIWNVDYGYPRPIRSGEVVTDHKLSEEGEPHS